MSKVPKAASQLGSLPSCCALRVVFSFRKHAPYILCVEISKTVLRSQRLTAVQWEEAAIGANSLSVNSGHGSIWCWAVFGANVSWCFCTNKSRTEAALEEHLLSELHNNPGRHWLLTPGLESNLKLSRLGGWLLDRFSLRLSLPLYLCPLRKAWKVSELGTARMSCQPSSSSSCSETKPGSRIPPACRPPRVLRARVFQGCSSSGDC